MSPNADVAVVGGGIIGCALAAFLAEDGARVRLYERDEIAAGASGRNSACSSTRWTRCSPTSSPPPSSTTASSATASRCRRRPSACSSSARTPPRSSRPAPTWPRASPSCGPRRSTRPHEAEPALAKDLAGFLIHTGRPVPPAAATQAFAARARAAGAEIIEGTAVTPVAANGRVSGVRTPTGETEPAGAVVVAAGPWSSALVDPTGAWRPVAPLWGVNVELRLCVPPRHSLEEGGIKDLMTGDALGPLFSLVTRGGVSALGSTFLPEQPEPAEVAPALMERGSRFVPQLAGTQAVSLRACARPISADGRPLLGPLPATRACSWPPATARGASRSAPARRGSSPTRCSAATRRSRPRSTPARF